MTTADADTDLGARTGRPATAVVVGGGWSGIAAAWYLSRHGVRVTLLDEQERLGGRSASYPLGARSVTLGGKNIGTRYTQFRAFAEAFGGGPFEHFGINSARVERGRLRTVDNNSRVRSAVGVLRRARPRDVVLLARMARWVRGDERDRFVGSPRFAALSRRRGDPTVAECFGPYLRDALVRPMTVRMNGAEPDEFHLADFGADLGMLLDRFEQLSDGFDPLFAAFAASVPVRCGTRVEALLVESGRTVGVSARGPDGTVEAHRADLTVVALPAHAGAALLRGPRPALAAELDGVRYFPACVVVAEYDRPIFGETTRALVFSAESVVSNAGAYGVEDRHVVRYTFSGRAARQVLATSSPEELRARAEAQLAAHFPALREAQLRRAASRSWEHALCAYGPGHSDRLRRLADLGATDPGLVLTGDYVRGASIEACFRGARDRVGAAVGAIAERT
jgi:oxygen-dependent protoporphyrinogen oxidase